MAGGWYAAIPGGHVPFLVDLGGLGVKPTHLRDPSRSAARLHPGQVAGINRNRWPLSSGLGGWFRPERAPQPVGWRHSWVHTTSSGPVSGLLSGGTTRTQRGAAPRQADLPSRHQRRTLTARTATLGWTFPLPAGHLLIRLEAPDDGS